MIVSQIVAMAENRVIGRDGGMPWHLPEDFKFFKATTMGHCIIMGRKTWDSIGRALPGRQSIVVSRSPEFKPPIGVICKSSVEDAIAYCQNHQERWGDECFIIGGGEIYRQSLPKVNRIYLTKVHMTVEGDTSYPEISPSEFRQVKLEAHLEAAVPFTFTTLERVEAER